MFRHRCHIQVRVFGPRQPLGRLSGAYYFPNPIYMFSLADESGVGAIGKRNNYENKFSVLRGPFALPLAGKPTPHLHRPYPISLPLLLIHRYSHLCIYIPNL